MPPRSFQSRFRNRIGLIFLLAFLAAARGIALPLEDDFLVFLEDFDGPEGEYTLPEVDELSSGYLSGMGVPNSGILLPNDGFVRFSLTTDLGGGDQSQSISLVGGSIDRTSASARAVQATHCGSRRSRAYRHCFHRLNPPRPTRV